MASRIVCLDALYNHGRISPAAIASGCRGRRVNLARRKMPIPREGSRTILKATELCCFSSKRIAALDILWAWNASSTATRQLSQYFYWGEPLLRRRLGGASGFTANGAGDISDTVALPSGSMITYKSDRDDQPDSQRDNLRHGDYNRSEWSHRSHSR